MLLLEDAVDERGLAASQEAGEDGDRNHVFLCRQFDPPGTFPRAERQQNHAARCLRTGLFEHIASQKVQRSAQLILTEHQRAEKRANYSTPGTTKQPDAATHGVTRP
jgi:hypothetical protein